jgi:glutathione reductase (NADPH)
MTTEPFDVVILSGGNAGIGVTGPVRRAGMSVALIEPRDLGGSCPNRGCTPKKILVAASHALHEIERARVHHVAVSKPKLDWAALIDRKTAMIMNIPTNMARAMEKRQVEVIIGTAAFAAPDLIRIGERLLKAKHVVIATGSRPRPLPFPGAEHMITSNEELSEREQPSSVIFVGGGVISLEFGHVYARAGTTVTILEAMPQLLPLMDKDAVVQLVLESERIGIRLTTNVRIQRIEAADGKLRVIYTRDGVEQAAEADRVVNGAGRFANVDTLDLGAGNVAQADGRVIVDGYLRSASNPLVYVCGDALPISPQLSPIATYEGDIVGRNIVEGPRHSPDYEGMASSVYTIPALASVGLTEAAARQKPFAVDVHVNDMLGWFTAKIYAETAAWSKIVVDRMTDRILGAHFCRTSEPGAHQRLRACDQVWHHGKPAQEPRLRLSNLFRRHQTHAWTRVMPHSAALSTLESPGISSGERYRRKCPRSRPIRRSGCSLRGDTTCAGNTFARHSGALFSPALSPDRSHLRRKLWQANALPTR